MWRFGRHGSPVVIDLRTDAHAATRRKPPPERTAGDHLELMAAAPVPAEPPRPHPLGHGHHDQLAIEEHDVDREAHADRVDAVQRVGQEQPRRRGERIASKQPAGRTRAEGACDVELRDHDGARFHIEELEHGASVHRMGARCSHRVSAETGAMRAQYVGVVRTRVPTIPLRYAPRMLCEDFHSGDDVTLGFLGRTYSFARRDFEQRVLRAAVDLDLVAKPVSRGERDDLVAAALYGSIEEPRSDVGERIEELRERGGKDPVYWLRKLVFRSAWLDHRIKHGQIDVAFDDAVGAFRVEPGRYPLPGSGHPSFACAEASS